MIRRHRRTGEPLVRPCVILRKLSLCLQRRVLIVVRRSCFASVAELDRNTGVLRESYQFFRGVAVRSRDTSVSVPSSFSGPINTKREAQCFRLVRRNLGSIL
jgi:hypothetical protein